MSYDNAALEQLSAFIDGRLSPDEAREVQARLATCEQYRSLHDQLTSAREVLRSTPAPPVPDGLLDGIRSEAEAEMAGGRASIWDRWRAPVGALAAAAVLLAVLGPWQVLDREGSDQFSPATEPTAIVTEHRSEEPERIAREAEESEPVVVAEAPTVESEQVDRPAVEAVAARRPTPPQERRARAEAPHAPAADGPETATAELPEETSAAEPASEPKLAAAPRSSGLSTARAEPLLSEAGRSSVTSLGARITIDDAPQIEEATPGGMESEMVAGVVAGMVLDQFVATHMVESSATMLAVVTDMPTSELGPRLADEDDTGSFGFSFTDAMRRALSESENQLP